MNQSTRINLLRKYILALLLSLSAVGAVSAKTTCDNTPQGRLCLAQVDFSEFAQEAYQPQQQSQWCWAASISMLYSYYKHPVSQARIVKDVYGGIVNMPAGSGLTMARQLNRDWVDDNGQAFSSRLTAAYDFDAGVNNINNVWMINELDQDRPFVIGNNSHAMVVTAIRYYVRPQAPQVVSVGVFDPWPGVGARGLSPAEMMPKHLNPQGALRFLATVSVTEPPAKRR